MDDRYDEEEEDITYKLNDIIFDFTADKESPYYLDKTEKERIKNHRIYLYREIIRLAP